MYKEADSNDPQVILTHAIEQMKVEQGDKFDINKINLAELSRRTGISRGKLRHYRWKMIRWRAGDDKVEHYFRFLRFF